MATDDLVRLDAGDTVFEEGSPGTHLYIVESGSVEITRLTPGGRKPLATFGPGTMFGEHAALRGLPRTATATATEPSVLQRMDRDGLIARMRADPLFGVKLLEHLSDITARIADDFAAAWRALGEDEASVLERLAELGISGSAAEPPAAD